MGYGDMSESLNESNAELQAVEIWRALMRRRRWILSTTLALVAAAWLAATFTPPQWDATAMVRIGVVGEKKQLIEPISNVTERVRLGAFKNAVVKSVAATSPDSALYISSLVVRSIPASDLVQLTVRGYSREKAQQFAQATAEHLSNVHRKLAAPVIGEINRQLEQIEKQIAQTDSERQRILKLLTARERGDIESRFMKSVMLTSITLQQGNERRELERERIKYADQLSTFRTYPTTMIEPVWVSEGPVFPNTRLIITLATLAGLFIGAVLAFVVHLIQSRKGIPG